MPSHRIAKWRSERPKMRLPAEIGKKEAGSGYRRATVIPYA